MRYTYYFDDVITSETVQELIDILVQFEQIDLYFTTPGGEKQSMGVLIDTINKHPDINIYLTGYIASAGTFLLTRCNHPVYITDDLDYILFHQADRSIDGSFRKSEIDREILHNQLQAENDTMAMEYKKLGLNAKEIKLFNKGENVVLYKKDFNRLKTAKLQQI